MCGSDVESAGTESELRKIEQNMCRWYDVKVRGVLGSGKKDVTEIGTKSQMDGRRIGIPGERHTQKTVDGGSGLRDEPNTTSNGAVWPEEITPAKDAEWLNVAATKRFNSSAATLNCMTDVL